MNVPKSDREKVRIARRIVQLLNASRFSVTIAECSSAVPISHGMKLTFSTGSQNHQPPQPSSIRAATANEKTIENPTYPK